LAKEEFSLIFDTYLSDDSKVMKVDLNLNGNPLTDDGEKAIDSIVSTTQTYLNDMGLNDTRIGVGGDPATVFDLKSIQQPEKIGDNLNDLLWIILYCTIAIFIVLAVAYRSIFLPVIYLCSAAFVYLISFAAIYFYFVNMGDYVGIKFITTMLGVLLIVPIVLSLFIHSRMDKGNEQATLSYTSIVSSIIIAISFIGFLMAGNIMFVQAALSIVIAFAITALFVLPLLLPALRRK
ncbi:MAG: MMPL family transporter, partial [Bacillaceae bacterium]